jgi:UDP-N-acetylglucosamine transferase subunit ALG13
VSNLSKKRNAIFVTVGTQLPFDRLITAIDCWAVQNSQTDIFAQVGEGSVLPFHIDSQARISMMEFARQVAHADLLISHAGMGSIITALDLGKPIVILPRLAVQGEHRNDHQLATANKFAHIDGIYLAHNENEIGSCIERALAAPKRAVEGQKLSVGGSRNIELINMVRKFIDGDEMQKCDVQQPVMTERNETWENYTT